MNLRSRAVKDSKIQVVIIHLWMRIMDENCEPQSLNMKYDFMWY